MKYSRDRILITPGKSFSKDGTASDVGLKFHAQHIQKMDKAIGDVSPGKMADFRILEEIRGETSP